MRSRASGRTRRSGRCRRSPAHTDRGPARSPAPPRSGPEARRGRRPSARRRCRCCRPRAARTARRATSRPTLPMNRRTAASLQPVSYLNMCWRTRWATRSVTIRGSWRRSRSCAPSPRRPSRGRRNGRRPASPACRCRGRGRRGGRPDGRARRRPSGACGPTDPRPRSCSGPRRAGRRARARWIEQAGVGEERSPTTAARRQQLGELGGDPLPGQMGNERPWSRIAASVAGSIAKPSVAASRTARTIRSASSSKRAGGSPTARSDPAGDVDAAAERIDERGSRGLVRADRRRRSARAPRHRVDREVAPRQVRLERRPELDPMRASVVGVVVVACGTS